MRNAHACWSLLICLLILGTATVAAQDEGMTTDMTVWLGNHYTSFNDYSHKVGEYNVGVNEWMPEGSFRLLHYGEGKLFRAFASFYDRRNMDGDLGLNLGDKLALDVTYRSLVHRPGQDKLANIAAREYFGQNDAGEDQFGGKIATHELQDMGVDYEVYRKEILSKLSLMLSKKNNIKLEAMHRSILEDGNEQGVTTSHCFSCHLVSEELVVENRTHEVQAGIQGDVSDKVTLGYEFDFRTFKSNAPEATRYYDTAKHPVHGGAGAEFSSRVLFDDTNLVHHRLPETQKMSHKLRTKARLGKTGRLNASFGYNTAENKNVDLTTESITGAARYTATLAPKTRIIAKASGARIEADDPFINIRDFRAGRDSPDYIQTDFDYTRYSSLDRTEVDVSAELIHRASKGLVLYWMNALELVDRTDYPVQDDGIRSKTFITQAKARFNKMQSFNGSVKYRYEKTVDPFISGRGIFEARGREELARTIPAGESVHRFIYYYAREGLRYQDITTDPNNRHEVEARLSFPTASNGSVNLSLTGWFQNTTDLDSLDVRSWQIRPNAMINLNPSPEWMVSAGYTMYMGKSRGPVTVALFDG
ncbi:hypothetical protein GF356_05350 [candidate division GN15 bacterium]|nr:hypothetical protein [candidate division GN15 bacterium]